MNQEHNAVLLCATLLPCWLMLASTAAPGAATAMVGSTAAMLAAVIVATRIQLPRAMPAAIATALFPANGFTNGPATSGWPIVRDRSQGAGSPDMRRKQ